MFAFNSLFLGFILIPIFLCINFSLGCTPICDMICPEVPCDGPNQMLGPPSGCACCRKCLDLIIRKSIML